MKMERVSINEDYVKEVLARHGELLQDIHKRILLLYEELGDTGSIIQSAAIKKMDLGRVGSGSRNVRDLADVMLAHQRIVKDREREVYAGLRGLMEEEEAVNRIWCCFQALPDKQRRYLERLYVEGEPYKAVEMASGVSHKTFEQARGAAIREILRMYEGDLSNVEIIAQGGMNRKTRSRRKGRNKDKSKGEAYEQMKLNL
jgi:hypothetical protein